jgi:hypothetical protein
MRYQVHTGHAFRVISVPGTDTNEPHLGYCASLSLHLKLPVSKTPGMISFESQQILLSKGEAAESLGGSQDEIDQLDSWNKLIFDGDFGRRVTGEHSVDSCVDELTKQVYQIVS